MQVGNGVKGCAFRAAGFLPAQQAAMARAPAWHGAAAVAYSVTTRDSRPLDFAHVFPHTVDQTLEVRRRRS